MLLQLNAWNEVLAFFVRRGLYTPAYWHNGGWRLFYTPDTQEIISFESLPSCLMFLETVAELQELGLAY